MRRAGTQPRLRARRSQLECASPSNDVGTVRISRMHVAELLSPVHCCARCVALDDPRWHRRRGDNEVNIFFCGVAHAIS